MEKSPYDHKENLRIYNKFFKRSDRIKYFVEKYELYDKKVLDIGCSYGHYLIRFSKESWGVDANDEMIKFARAIGLKVKKANIEEELPFENKSFDAVWCSGVIEHMIAPHKLLLEIHRVLKDDGIVILNVPIYSKIFKGYSAVEHLYAFTPDTFKFMVTRAGFHVIEDKGYIRKFPKIVNICFAPLFKMFGPNIFVVAKKIKNFKYPEKRLEVFNPSWTK